ncbi:MAG TPA: FUSC family protein [Terrimesophilobacter sp.]|nr:FUSC family protein [Terrimesophilobacter sp.]
MRLTSSLRASSRSPLLQVLKTSLASVGAWVVCVVLLNQPLPIFAAIAALLVVQPSVNLSLAKGIERSLGVVIGVILASGATLLFGHAMWVVLGIIVVSLLLAWALQLTPGSSVQIPISAMLVVAMGAQTPGYAASRVLETMIGAVIGLIVNVVVVPPVLLAPAHDSVTRLADAIATTLESLADGLLSRKNPEVFEKILVDARDLRRLRDAAGSDITRAGDSLMLNPRGAKHRDLLDRDKDFLASLTILVTRVLGVARAIRDHYDVDLSDNPVVRSVATELARAGHDVRLLARHRQDPGGTGMPGGSDRMPITAELPALTAPLLISKPHPEHWILIGSLMEDLRRIREVITGDV